MRENRALKSVRTANKARAKLNYVKARCDRVLIHESTRRDSAALFHREELRLPPRAILYSADCAGTYDPDLCLMTDPGTVTELFVFLRLVDTLKDNEMSFELEMTRESRIDRIVNPYSRKSLCMDTDIG